MFEGSLFDYPERRGWDKNRLYHGDFDGKSLEETQGFLQEWLYFGPLIHILDILEMSFDYRDFISKDENGEEWISTAKLPVYLERWYMRPRFSFQGGRSLAQKQETYRHVYDGLREIHRYVLRYCGRDSNSGKYYPPATFWPLTPELSLSIIVLADSLTKAGFEATGINFNLDWGVSGLLVERMITSGWCPSVVNTLTTTQQVHLFYSVQTLGGPYLVRNHTNCSELVCKVDQIDEKSYITEHTVDGCKCDFKGPNISEVVDILKSGGIPLIECYGTEGNLYVRVVRRMTGAQGGDYVAISHIWSDGLGNPLQNALPICQLWRLQKLVNTIGMTPNTSPRAWWCDTLCVPVEKNLLEWRKIAIKRMRDTYMNANKVLVLDKGLLSISHNTSTLEIYLKLKVSKWMCRLWTLQEGMIGRTIVMQLLDDTMEFSHLDKSMVEEEMKSYRFIYSRYGHDSQAVLGGFLRPNHESRYMNLEAYSKQLQWRSTSKQGDEAVCLMSMLGMTEHLEEMLKLQENDYAGRMTYFFRHLEAIPIKMLYQPPPRLSTLGYRWAPTSFLSCFRETRTEPYRTMRGVGHIGPDGFGFVYKSAGLQLIEDGQALQLGKGFLVRPLPDNSDAVREIFIAYAGATNDKTTDWAATNIDGSTKLKRPAIIIAQPLFSLPIVDGLLVDIFENADTGRISCYYIAWVGISAHISSVTWLNSGPPKPWQARILKEEQEWLLM